MDRDLDQILRDLVPHDLKILVHLPDDPTQGACMAQSLEYPIVCAGDDINQAVRELLINTCAYLANCAEDETFAPCWSEVAYYAAFSFGHPVSTKFLADVRVTPELERYLRLAKRKKLSSVVQIRDIRYLQERLNERNIDELCDRFVA